ncbi:MAG: alpha/beta fold hydrolase [Acidimicrobiales bacterium]
MSLFVLVHGAYHGGWCWSRLVPELERFGHGAIAPDLPCDDPGAGYDEYVAAVLAAMDTADAASRAGTAGAGGDVVVVGHSLGGFTIPLVAQRRPVRRLVFLCTAPVVGGPRADELRARMVTPRFGAMARFRDEHGRAVMSAADAWEGFYGDCDDATAAWAIARLRPQGARPMLDPWPITSWPDAARSVILTRDDGAVSIDAAQQAGRLILDGGEPLLMDGSHSPFLSRPAELALLLHNTNV